MLCSQCGKTIEKEEAQFCPHCGAPVQRQLREQIAEQPGAKRQPPAPAHIAAPQQMGKEHPGEERPALKEQMAHIRPSSHPVPPAASTVPETPSDTGRQSADHDLEAVPPVRPYAAEGVAHLPSTPPLVGQKGSEEEEPIEDRPTQLVASHPSTEQKANRKEDVPIEDRPTNQMEHLPPSEQKANRKEGVPIEDRPTNQMEHLPAAERKDSKRGENPVADFPTLPMTYRSSTSAADSPGPAQGRISRKLVALVLVVLVLVIAGVWIIVAQPFSVPAVTQPQVSFNDSTLHISLLYPNGWLYKVSPGQSTVLFHDSSNTAQMTIVTANANGNDLATYLQSQADHAGIATPKTVSPESFAGATWQGVQGTVQQKGANYTCTIFATVQGKRLITIIQQAPQTTYNEEDNLVFSRMRTSLKLS